MVLRSFVQIAFGNFSYPQYDTCSWLKNVNLRCEKMKNKLKSTNTYFIQISSFPDLVPIEIGIEIGTSIKLLGVFNEILGKTVW